MKRERFFDVEEPDDIIVVTFLGNGSKAKKRQRACNVKLTVEGGTLRVEIVGADDRCTTISDQFYDIPKEDMRR